MAAASMLLLGGILIIGFNWERLAGGQAEDYYKSRVKGGLDSQLPEEMRTEYVKDIFTKIQKVKRDYKRRKEEKEVER